MVQRVVTVAMVCLGVLAGGSAAASASTYVANCGITGYLAFKPDAFSGGCTGGSLNVNKLRWRAYGASRASATGRLALRKPCGYNPCSMAGHYEAPARLRFSAPRTCSGGEAAGERYFSRVRVKARMGAGNPFGFRAGWKVFRVRIDDTGECSYSP